MTQKKLEIQLYKKNPFLPLLQNDSTVNKKQFLSGQEEQLRSAIKELPPQFCGLENYNGLISHDEVKTRYAILPLLMRTHFLFSARVTDDLPLSEHPAALEKPSEVVLK